MKHGRNGIELEPKLEFMLLELDLKILGGHSIPAQANFGGNETEITTMADML